MSEEMITVDGVEIPQKLSFFILEDMEQFQKKLVQDLQDIGFRGSVYLAGSLAECMDKITKCEPQFILSDWNLPDGTADAFFKYIRSQEKYDNIPFLVVTTIDDVDNILGAVKMGADGYVVKTWTLEQMSQNISFAYNKRTG